jgi:hypothetical protein
MQGAADRATQMWQKALEVDPENKAAQMYLRMASGAAGGVPTASDAAEKAILGGKLDD